MVGTCKHGSEPSGTTKGGECVNQQKPDVFIHLVCGPENSLLDVSTSEHETMKLSRNIGHRLPSVAVSSLKNGDPNCAAAKA